MVVSGTNGSDILLGSESGDEIAGLAGRDWIRGLAGDDSIAGGFSDDALFGGAGNDTLHGDEGNDLLSGDEGNDVLDGGEGLHDVAWYAGASGPVAVDLGAGTGAGAAGTDALSNIEDLAGSAFADTLTGNAGDNRITGNAGADILHGAAGNDLLAGAAGYDVLDGGDGNDTLDGGPGNDTVVGGAGIDTADFSRAVTGVHADLSAGAAQDGAGGIDVLAQVENIHGGRFGDVLAGDASDNVFEPGAGDDTVDGGAGIDAVAYDDVLSGVTVNLASGVASRGAGHDVLVSIEQAVGSPFDDILIGGLSNDTLAGGAGEDTLDGGAGNDSLVGGLNDGEAGVDWVSYLFASGPVAVNLATGLATGAGGTDSLQAIEGVIGTAYADTLTGSAGNDELRGNGGDDSIDGGAGSADWVDYASAAGAVTVMLASGTSTGADGNDAFQNVECAAGGASADVLVGNAGDNLLRGNGGNDTLEGAGGRDGADYRDAAGPVTVRLDLGTSSGADGNDVLLHIEDIYGSNGFGDVLVGDASANVIDGRNGNDTIDGGAGTDVAVFSGRFAQYRIAIEAGNFDLIVAGPDGVDRLDNVEVLKFDDRVFIVQQGRELPDHLAGGDAGDLIRGREGNDTVSGGAGDDAVYGDDGTDTLAGGTGDDLLDGGTGSDSMSGGDGSDTYMVDSASDMVVETAGSQALAASRGDDADPADPKRGIGDDIDTVVASIAYTLGSFVENLTLADGAGDLSGTGNALDNTVEGNDGDNALAGGAGDDTITGGGGVDTVVYGGARADYLVTPNDDGTFSVEGPASDGTDVVAVERIAFSDGGLALDVDGGHAGSVAQLLGAVFGAASVSNAAYVGIGLDAADAGSSDDALAQFALDAALGAGASHEQVVTLLYTNVIGTAPDAAALSFYTGLLDAGDYTTASLAVMAAQTSYNQSNIDLAGLSQAGIVFV